MFTPSILRRIVCPLLAMLLAGCASTASSGSASLSGGGGEPDDGSISLNVSPSSVYVGGKVTMNADVSPAQYKDGNNDIQTYDLNTVHVGFSPVTQVTKNFQDDNAAEAYWIAEMPDGTPEGENGSVDVTASIAQPPTPGTYDPDHDTQSITVKPIDVTATANKADPDPAYVGEDIESDLSASADGPSGNDVDGPTWSWAIAKVEMRISSDEDWAVADSDSYDLSIEDADQNDDAAKLKGKLFVAAFWKITVTATATFSRPNAGPWSGSDDDELELVAGEWRLANSEIEPDPATAAPVNPIINAIGDANLNKWMDKDIRSQTLYYSALHNFPYMSRSHNRLNFSSGTTVHGSGWGGSVLAATDAGTWQDQAPDSYWKQVKQWYPLGSTPRPTQFDYKVTVALSWSVQGDVDNGRLFPLGEGYTNDLAEIAVTAAPGTSGASTQTVTHNLHRKEGDSIVWSISLPWGIGASLENNDQWAASSSTGVRFIDGTINSGQSDKVDVKALIRSYANIGWKNKAIGPFEASASVFVYSIEITRH